MHISLCSQTLYCFLLGIVINFVYVLCTLWCFIIGFQSLFFSGWYILTPATKWSKYITYTVTNKETISTSIRYQYCFKVLKHFRYDDIRTSCKLFFLSKIIIGSYCHGYNITLLYSIIGYSMIWWKYFMILFYFHP